jgi:hypothetical protein
VSMEEHVLAWGSEANEIAHPVGIRLSGEPVMLSAEVLLRVEGRLVYGSYRTKSLPGACQQALREHPGAEVLQVRRLVEAVEEG